MTFYRLKTLFWTSLGLLMIACGGNDKRQIEKDNLTLWYKQPAEKWTEALPVGNGRLGAMVFGGIEKERIQLNEESVWAGTRINNNNPQAAKHLKEIRRLLLAQENDKARKLADKYLLGTPPRIRSYQTLGDLNFEFSYGEEAGAGYYRALNLADGISSVRFKAGKTTFTREAFSSASDNVIVVHLKSDKKAKLNFSVSLTREKDAETRPADDNTLLMLGQILDEDKPERGPLGAHLKFAAKLTAKNKGGAVQAENSRIIVKDADEVTLILTAVSDYNINKLNYDRSINPAAQCDSILEMAVKKSYETLKKRHIADHSAMFKRVAIELGDDAKAAIPTDERLQRVKKGQTDNALIALYFQYGRYLLMDSSRPPGVLPANLQGIWNEHIDAPWNSDFHTNINLQMNYWPAEVCNLPETVIPLTNFFLKLMEPGSVTAKEMYEARGWTMHHLTDPYGHTGLMDGIGWGTSPLAGSWMALTFWRHYQFTMDEGYLREKAWPIMKGAAQFVLDFLIEDGKGHLVTAPSLSPENAYLHPKTGKKTGFTYAAAIDIEIINELFKACIKTSDILNSGREFAEQLKNVLDKLPPVRVGEDGTIMEWIEDYQEAEPGHRHMSHLFALHPGTQITEETPQLWEAARKTIEKRLANGGGHTGWSRAWIVNFYARLFDGENAYKHLLALLKKSTLPNLFDSHPPFQIDGNFGGTAGIAGMLLQSHNGIIHILPALPQEWPEGFVKGLKARGNFTLDIYWQQGQMSKVALRSVSGGDCNIRYKDKTIHFSTEAGKEYIFDNNLMPQSGGDGV